MVREAGPDLQVWPGQMHVFQLLPWLPESGAALDEAARSVAALDAEETADVG